MYNLEVVTLYICCWRLDADLRVQVRKRARLRRDAEDVRRSLGGVRRVWRPGEKGPPTGRHLLQGLGLLLYGLQQEGPEAGVEGDRKERRVGHQRRLRE